MPADPEAWSAQTVEEEAWFPVTCAHEPGPCSTLVQRADAAAGGEGGGYPEERLLRHTQPIEFAPWQGLHSTLIQFCKCIQ